MPNLPLRQRTGLRPGFSSVNRTRNFQIAMLSQHINLVSNQKRPCVAKRKPSGYFPGFSVVIGNQYLREHRKLRIKRIRPGSLQPSDAPSAKIHSNYQSSIRKRQKTGTVTIDILRGIRVCSNGKRVGQRNNFFHHIPPVIPSRLRS